MVDSTLEDTTLDPKKWKKPLFFDRRKKLCGFDGVTGKIRRLH